MKYRYDYDVKDDLMELLQRKNDFSGAEELRYYFQIYISMLADAPDGQFTPEEEKEVLAILGSFRTE